MIKVLLLIPTLDRSGAEKQLTLVATRLPRDEFDVQVVALTRGGAYEAVLREHGISVTVLHKRLKFDPAALWRLKRLIASTQPDILHTWLFAANSYGRLACDNRRGPRVVVSERCVDAWKGGWQLWLDRRQIARTERLIANSEAVADFYRGLGYPADRITVIRNGIEVDEAPRPDSVEVWREFDIPAGARVVGYVGRLAKQKRVHDLVWAFQLLRQCTENVYFVIVGDGPERGRLVRLAKHMGCDHLVRFAGHRTDALQLVRAMNVFWLGSDFEGMSNSVMEAMAAGLPVVATDILPNRELVVDGQTGFLVQVGDSVGFSQFTDRILADADMARRLGDAGLERMRSEFSIERMVEAHAALYRSVVTTNAGAEAARR